MPTGLPLSISRNFLYTGRTGGEMIAVEAYYDGRAFVPKIPVSVEINQEAIITLLEPQSSNVSPRERLLSLVGSISHEDYLEMEEALKETERVYPNEW
jgi:hypothetical protein